MGVLTELLAAPQHLADVWMGLSGESSPRPMRETSLSGL